MQYYLWNCNSILAGFEVQDYLIVLKICNNGHIYINDIYKKSLVNKFIWTTFNAGGLFKNINIFRKNIIPI